MVYQDRAFGFERLRNLMTTRALSPADQLLASADVALRTLFAKPRAARETPPAAPASPLTESERRHAAGLMQALYSAQALMAKTDAQRAMFEHAAREETDHLAWTAERLDELGARPSLLNPLWYAGSFGLGLIAGRLGDSASLGFVVETERQVEAHLSSHLQNDAKGLPANDLASRAIAAQMQLDEAAHGLAAQEAGAIELADIMKLAMKCISLQMTAVAYYF
jgi:3-demethoxyubiquinol 3-hydroxylase